MAIFISEYAQMLFLGGGQMAIPQEPAIRVQTLECGEVSEAFIPGVRVVRVYTDGNVAVAFGPNPVATAASARMAAGGTEFFGVQTGDRMAAIRVGDQRQGDSTFALLEVIRNADAAQARLAEINAATTANTKTVAEMKAAAVEMDREKVDLTKREAALAQQTEALAGTRATLDAQAAQIGKDQDALDARIAIAETENKRMVDFEKRLVARDSELVAREKAIETREKQTATREDALKVSEAGYRNRMARLKELAGGAQ